ncbi:MAG: thioredoxin domain-containing protein [Actinomycetota bacterium]
MAISEVDGPQLDEVLQAEDRGVIIDFWGTWCQPCRTLRPHLDTLADDFADDWRVVAVHVEANEDLVDRYDITATPTFVFLRGGAEVHRIAGAVPPSSLAEAMAEHG